MTQTTDLVARQKPIYTTSTGVNAAIIADGSVSNTEFQYLNTVTSNVQTQLDARLLKSGGTMTGFIVLHDDPQLAMHPTSKQYVDAIANGLKWKPAVRVATAAAGTLISDFEAGDTVDGVVIASFDRILIKNQVDASENGIYVVAAIGAPIREPDADVFGELNGAVVFVQEGTANANRGFMQVTELSSFAGQVWTQNFGTGLYAADESTLTLSGQTFSIKSGGITNTQVNASAAIDISKLGTSTSTAIGVGSIELGHASDTTIARVSAGIVSVEGVNLVNISTAQTLTNKTLTSPAIGTAILDTNGNELFKLTATGSAVNEITLANAATGNSPRITATGGDANPSLELYAQGSGVIFAGSDFWTNGYLKHKARYTDRVAITYTGTDNINWALGDTFYILLGGNEVFTISNSLTGQTIRLMVQQDGTGTRTITWFAGISWDNGNTPPTISTVGNRLDVFEFYRFASGNIHGRAISIGTPN
jgi:hypothetical protein